MARRNFFPSIKWSIFWIGVHSCSVWLLSILLSSLTNFFIFVLLNGFGIIVIARIIRTRTQNEKFSINGEFILWGCLTCFSFWLVRLILSLSNVFDGVLYFVLMGAGIYAIPHVFNLILKQKGKIREKVERVRKKEPRKIFLISDTHFGHRNILHYCHRPFRTTQSMDRTIRKRWNSTVRRHDIVFFLGDFVFRGSIGYWIRRLHGRKKFIRGNHDFKMKHTVHHLVFHHKGINFYLVHNPLHAPRNWDGWVIYGHVHNHNTSVFPFIDGSKKRINVCVEVIDYRPVSLDYILSLNLPTIRRMRTIHSKIEHW